MRSQNASSRWVIASAMFFAFCSRGNTPTLVSPSNERGQATAAAAVGAEGTAGASALGDTKNGPIEISLVRVAQTDGVPAFYASAGGVYGVTANREVEIYVQIWTSDSPLAAPPRLGIQWGDEQVDVIHCGPCRLSRTFEKEGRHSVTVTMDDRVGGTTKRTFILDSRVAAPTTGPTASQTFSYTGEVEDFTVPLGVTSVTIEAWGAQGGTLHNSIFGGPGGLGAYIKGTFAVTTGDVLNVVVGKEGDGSGGAASGGGGSGVSRSGSPLVVAGGGGGQAYNDLLPTYAGMDAVTAMSGQPGHDPSGDGSGSGGSGGGDGGDFVLASFLTAGGRGFNSGSVGSTGQNGGGGLSGNFGLGGGGGGAQAVGCSGGGGGYSGGGAGGGFGSGGGGGSFNDGTGQTNTAHVQTGNGTVKISW